MRIVPNYDQSDEQLTTYSRKRFDDKSFAEKTKKWLEEQTWGQYILFCLVLASSCMLIGDGILTPPISGLSSVNR